MSIVQRTKTYAVCPSCGEDAGSVDHLLGLETVTWWYCDACGQRYQLAFSKNGAVAITKAEGRKVTTIDVLRLMPQTKPVYFIVGGMRFEDERHAVDERKRLFYESHSCPTNWLDPLMMYFDGDADPHGLIEFIETRDDGSFPPDEDCGPNARDRAFVDLIERNESARAADAVDPQADSTGTLSPRDEKSLRSTHLGDASAMAPEET